MSMTTRWFALALIMVSAGAAAQKKRPQPNIPTIKTTTRLVLVDVIATDNQGRPITDLQASDFIVQENGKPQKIASFVRMPEQDKPPAPPPPPLPPDVFTNDPRYQTVSGPPIIVLLDLLNTPMADRPRVRSVMIDFIQKQLRPGQTAAVFLLGQKLRLLQDFTSDPRILLAAMDRVKGNPREPSADRSNSDLIQIKIDHTSDPITLAQLEQIQEVAQRFESEYQSAATVDRVERLLQATTAIARAAHGIPGRKALIWLTAGFPIEVKKGQVAEYYPTSQEVVSFTELLGRMAASLNDAEIAIYPVDVRGLDSPAPLWGDTSLRTNRINRTRSRNESPLASEEMAALESSQDSLMRMAEQTGGRAFLNRNDQDSAVASAANDGLHYYTISYYPENKRWNGSFRKIELKVARKDVRLRYRRGYYADDPAGWQKQADRELRGALQSDPLTTARVVFSGRAIKPIPGQPVSMEFLLPPTSIHFEQQNGVYVGSVDFHAAALTDDDKVTLTAAKTSDFSLDPQRYQQVMAFPSLTTSVPLTLEPGKYRVRLLIRDNLTGNLGTVEIPVTVPKK